MKVFIADLFSEEGVKEIKAMGCEVMYDAKVVGDKFKEAVAGFKHNILIVRSKKVPADVIDAFPGLEYIIRAGAGFDTIDVKHASKKGVYVSNCPGKNNIAVAELAIGLLICIDRRICENDRYMKEGKFEKGLYANCNGLKGRTLGLLGVGFVGREVAKRALAFDIKVLGVDPFICKEDMEAMGVTKCDSLEECAKQSDIISLHLPKLPETEKMINAKFLSLIKPSAVIINTARADLVVEEDILERLEKNPEFYYACDVLMGEPAEKKAAFDSKLGKHPKCIATHHIGASTKQAEDAIGKEAVRMVGEYKKTKLICNCVNLAKDIPKMHILNVKF